MTQLIYKGHLYHQASSLPTFEEVWERWPKTDLPYSIQEELNWAPRGQGMQVAQEEIRKLYGAAVERLTGGLQDEECWRSVTLPAGTVPEAVKALGIYWAYDEEAAFAHWGEGDVEYVYRAKIDLQYVDLHETLLANIRHAEEYEIRFQPDSPIFVYDAANPHEPGTTVDINAMRRC